MNTKHRLAWTKVAALGLLLAVSGQTLAGPQDSRQDGVISRTVDVRDIDFANLGDVEVAYKRIGKAARRVCRTALGRISGARSRRDWQECVGAAIDNAVLSANSPTLTAVHRGTTERLAGL